MTRAGATTAPPRRKAARRRLAPGASHVVADAAGLIPRQLDRVSVVVGERRVTLTNLTKVFWPALGLNKGDLIRYYLTVAPVLLPHIRDRAMVMRRYPDGATGPSFFMKRAPAQRPEWLAICRITHSSGTVIDFPMIQDVPSLLWVVNLGCIDLNQWYARADDVDRPDYLHFDLDPGTGASFAAVRETALLLHEALTAIGMPSFVKTTGSRGLHVYIPIVRGPTQREVWAFAKTIARECAAAHPRLMTTEYAVAKRPTGRVVIDYNQNAWGRTLASVYSVRPSPRAAVSTPVTWRELAHGIVTEDFRIDTVPARVRRRGDLWAPLLARRGRFDLGRYTG
jgi:bifunctional non-homologous end joining protein LigD